MTITESGQDIRITGKSGDIFHGKIYADKDSRTEFSGNVIVCLTNSRFADNEWHHHMNSIYLQYAETAMEHFKTRDDISHVIIIPHQAANSGDKDPIDDLIRNYLHG
jgi:hypothetical protein